MLFLHSASDTEEKPCNYPAVLTPLGNSFWITGKSDKYFDFGLMGTEPVVSSWCLECSCLLYPFLCTNFLDVGIIWGWGNTFINYKQKKICLIYFILDSHCIKPVKTILLWLHPCFSSIDYSGVKSKMNLSAQFKSNDWLKSRGESPVSKSSAVLSLCQHLIPFAYKPISLL